MELLDRLNVDFGLQTSAPQQVILLPYLTSTGDVQIGAINLAGVDSSNAIPAPQTFALTLKLPQSPADPLASWVEIFGTDEDVTPDIQGNHITVPISIEIGGLLTMANTSGAAHSIYYPAIAKNFEVQSYPFE